MIKDGIGNHQNVEPRWLALPLLRQHRDLRHPPGTSPASAFDLTLVAFDPPRSDGRKKIDRRPEGVTNRLESPQALQAAYFRRLAQDSNSCLVRHGGQRRLDRLFTTNSRSGRTSPQSSHCRNKLLWSG